ncbi:hypothetical protein VTG60DRAFT_2283 [Thermothelomyces hinnuleus]
MPPGYGSEEDTRAALELDRRMRLAEKEEVLWDYFRIVPDDELVVPLLGAFARAVAQMPALKSACLTASLRRPYTVWFVCFDAPGADSGHNHFLDDPDRGTSEPRVFFRVHHWKPPKQVLDLFQGREGETPAGTRRHSPTALEMAGHRPPLIKYARNI